MVLVALFGLPSLILRLGGIHPDPLIGSAIHGIGILSAAFLLTWGAETAEIFEKLQQLPSIAAVDILKADRGRFELQSQPEQLSNQAVFELCVRQKWVLHEMIPFETRLEDIFRDLTLK